MYCQDNKVGLCADKGCFDTSCIDRNNDSMFVSVWIVPWRNAVLWVFSRVSPSKIRAYSSNLSNAFSNGGVWAHHTLCRGVDPVIEYTVTFLVLLPVVLVPRWVEYIETEGRVSWLAAHFWWLFLVWRFLLLFVGSASLIRHSFSESLCWKSGMSCLLTCLDCK